VAHRNLHISRQRSRTAHIPLAPRPMPQGSFSGLARGTPVGF
jgi:hypothetical protein